ncbi:MAG: MFS transporter [Acidobacteriota bacterium]
MPSSPNLSAPLPPSPSGTLRAVVVPSLFLMAAMFNQTLIVAGLKELMIDDLGGTTTDASLFFSVEMLAYILFAPLWGVLSDRWGRRRPLVVVGFAMSSVLYLSYPYVHSIPSLLALRFVQGAFTVMGWSTLMSMVLDQPDEARRGRYMGLMGGALILGVSLGAPIGGFVSRDLGTRAPLWVAGGLFMILALGSLALPEQERLRRQLRLGDIFSTLKGRPRLLLPCIFQFVDRYTVGFMVVLFPQYLESIAGADPAVRGKYLALFLLPFAFLQYFAGRLSEKTGPYLPLFAGSLLYGIAMCFVGFSDQQGLWWVMVSLGVLASLMFPPAITLTAQLSDPETRGSAMGGFNLAGSLGFAIGPLVGTWAHATGGFGFAFIVSGSLEILLVAVAWWVVRRWR